MCICEFIASNSAIGKSILIMITQEPITLDKIRNDQVKGFECSYWKEMGLWNVQYLGDGHQDFFKTIEEAQEWLITWQECGE